ncbi:RNA methyltransferase [Kerstersia similis]|uniref:RNA methyltransferase n=1 Tax=Kerstersia similis TaxID=206505 RepID=UPI0039EF603B
MTPVFSRVRFIMTSPSHPGNVGAAARAIKTMGFSSLVLVTPKLDDITLHPDAIAMASGADDILSGALITASLEEALAPVTRAYALTARPRDIGPPVCDIREAAAESRELLVSQADASVAIVLGTERSGLTNAHIALCQRICHIPANPEYSSLNVAQALQLAAWEMRYALGAEGRALPHTPIQSIDPGTALASNGQVQAFLEHWREALIAVGFLDPEHPKKLVPRMQHLFGRSALTRDEVDMMRGVCTAMLAPQHHRKPS